MPLAFPFTTPRFTFTVTPSARSSPPAAAARRRGSAGGAPGPGGLAAGEEAGPVAVPGTRHYAKRQVTWLRNTLGAEQEFATAAELVDFVVRRGGYGGL